MNIQIESFGIARHTPTPDFYVISALRLWNPHSLPGLRQLDGRDPKVAKALEYDAALPRIISEAQGAIRDGATRLSFYCYGGRHRSVFVAERFAAELTRQGHTVTVTHQGLQ